MDYEKKLQDYYRRSLRQGGGEGYSQVICPTTYDKPCKLCSACHEILKDRSNQGTKLRDKAYNLNQKHKYYSNAVFPGVNPSQVIVLEYGDKIFPKVIGYQMDPNSDYKNWLHPIQGRNVYIIKTPGASKDKNSYDVEPRASASRLIDMSVLERLYPLDEIISLIKAGTVKPFYQSKFEPGRTEVRFLPSWLGPNSNVFFFGVSYHYGVTEEEFNAIQSGDLDPFTTYVQDRLEPSPKEAPSQPASVTVSPPKGGAWGDILANEALKGRVFEPPTAAPVEVKAEEEDSLYPGCFGGYDTNNKQCTTICTEEGWAGACQITTKEKAAKRAAAKRLSVK